MTTPTPHPPNITGVDRDALAAVLREANGTRKGDIYRYLADVALAHIAARHECALPATWDDGGARPVEGEHGWVTPLLPDGTQRFPDGTPVEAWHPACGDGFRYLYYVAGNKYTDVLSPGALRPLNLWPGGALIRPVLPPIAPACDHDHADDWVEVGESTWNDMPPGTRVRTEWEWWATTARRFIHRDDLPDPDAELVERMARAIWNAEGTDIEWESQAEGYREDYRKAARAALAALREGER